MYGWTEPLKGEVVGELLDLLSEEIIKIAAGAVVIVLVAIARFVVTREKRAARRDDVTIADINDRVIELRNAVEGLDRAQAQRFKSMAHEYERVIAETEKEVRHQFDRLHDRLNIKGDR